MGAGYHGGFGSTNGAKKQGGTGTQAQRPKTVKLLRTIYKDRFVKVIVELESH